MWRVVLCLSFIFFVSLMCRAETVRLYTAKPFINTGQQISIMASGFTESRYRFRPLSEKLLLSVFDPADNLWVNSGALWAEMPYLREDNIIRIEGKSAVSAPFYFQLLDTVNNKVYETTPSVLYSEEDVRKFSESYSRQAEKVMYGTENQAQNIIVSGLGPDSEPESPSAREIPLRLSNSAIMLSGVLLGLGVLTVYSLYEKNPLLDDKIH